MVERISNAMGVCEALATSRYESDRFRPMPLEMTLEIDGIVVDVATDSQILLDRLQSRCPLSGRRSAESSCAWKIVIEPSQESLSEVGGLTPHGLRHGGLAYLAIGGGGFLAYDREAREGISFVPETIVQDEGAFVRYFLPALARLMKEGREAM